MSERIRIRVVIRGAVQGVGFRPFVFRLATRLGLTGYVVNSMEGVVIEAEGTKHRLDDFLISVRTERPPKASIQSCEYSLLDPAGFSNFEIRESDSHGKGRALVLTDGVFSMDGDLAPLPAIASACARHGAFLAVDDAHGLGGGTGNARLLFGLVGARTTA